MAEGEASSGTSPFTDEDFQRALNEEKANSAEEGWSRLKETEHVEIWRKIEQGVDTHLIKSFLKFPGVSAEDVLTLLADLKHRFRWDDKLIGFECLEKFENYDVVHSTVKVPSPCSNRDFVRFRTTRRDKDKIMVLFKNTTHDKAPVQKNIVRGELIFSAMILRPDESNPGSSKMTSLVQVDLKGSMPKFVVNYFAVDAPINMHGALVKYYHTTYSKEKETSKAES